MSLWCDLKLYAMRDILGHTCICVTCVQAWIRHYPHPIQNVSALYWSRCQKINRVSGHVHTPWNSQFDCTSMAVWHVYYGCCVVPVVNCFKMSLHIRTAPFAWRWEVGSQLPMPCAAIFFSFLFFFFFPVASRCLFCSTAVDKLALLEVDFARLKI